VVIRDDKIVMLCRTQDRQGTSRLGYAESTDGIHFSRRDEPILSPETDYEKDGGVEDPRLVRFGDTYYLTYTGYNKKACAAVDSAPAFPVVIRVLCVASTCHIPPAQKWLIFSENGV
jgi:predicted GH43/DUF377 family glycosyl hydrolase